MLALNESVNVTSETEQKASELDCLHNLMKEKLTILYTLKRYKFYHLHKIHGPVDTVQNLNVSEYLVRTARELKKVKGILAKPEQKQAKVIKVLSMYENVEFSHQMPAKKDYVSIAKGVHKQKHLVLCNLRDFLMNS